MFLCDPRLGMCFFLFLLFLYASCIVINYVFRFHKLSQCVLYTLQFLNNVFESPLIQFNTFNLFTYAHQSLILIHSNIPSCFVHNFIDWLIDSYSFQYSLIFLHYFIDWLIDSYSFQYSLIFLHYFIDWLIDSYSFQYSLIFLHYFIDWLIDSYSFKYSLIFLHYFIDRLIDWLIFGFLSKSSCFPIITRFFDFLSLFYTFPWAAFFLKTQRLSIPSANMQTPIQVFSSPKKNLFSILRTVRNNVDNYVTFLYVH